MFNSHITAIIMGPECQNRHSSTSINFGALTDSPSFITGSTNKIEYRNDLKMWLTLINQFATADNKPKAILYGAGFATYRYCDVSAQELIRMAMKTRTFKLEGSPEDHNRQSLIEEGLKLITENSLTEIVKQEVDLLMQIQACSLMEDETVKEYTL